ncbi:MAG: hypothetical protein WKG06_38245 [Segetibacter sp.]
MLLRFSPPPLVSYYPLYACIPIMVNRTTAASLVPYKTLPLHCCHLYPGCCVNSNQDALYTYNRRKRTHLLSTSFVCLYEASIGGSIYSALQCAPTAVFAAVFPYRSPQKAFPLNAA